MTSILFTLDIKKIDSGYTKVSISCAKMQFKNEFLLGPVGFVLVGYMGGGTFLGLLASAMGMCH
jgi:hypothetical protein